jgi:hypothetical protein
MSTGNSFLLWQGELAAGSLFKILKYKKNVLKISDKVYQLLAHGRWFTPASSTTKTGRHDIAEILLKVALNTKKSKNQIII